MGKLTKIALGLGLCLVSYAQNGAQRVSIATPSVPEVTQTFYDGSNNLRYVCTANQKQAATSVQISDATLTSIVVLTNVGTVTTSTAHGLYAGATVVVSGATVDTDLNATYVIATVPSSTTYTIATVAVSDATYTDAGLVVSTTNPLLIAAQWAINILTYNGSNLFTGSYWAKAGVSYNLKCSDRATY